MPCHVNNQYIYRKYRKLEFVFVFKKNKQLENEKRVQVIEGLKCFIFINAF